MAKRNGLKEYLEAHYTKMGLKILGRQKTEERLRELYAQSETKEDESWIGSFLLSWKSKRGLQVADDWMSEGPSDIMFDRILKRYSLRDGIETADRFLSILAQKDLSNNNRDVAIDAFSSCISFHDHHPRYAEFLQVIADHLDHACPEVRWTAIFSIANLGAKQYRDKLVDLQQDKTKTAYGYISAVARNGVRELDGEDDVNLHDAKER